MVKTTAKTVKEYLASLPRERAKVMRAVRKVILDNLPKGYEETINWGMISYEIPLKTYPTTYNKKPLVTAALAAQKNYYSLHLMGLYWDKRKREWFENEYKKKKIKLNKGLGCVRFKTLDEIPLDIVGKAIALNSVKEYIKDYEHNMKTKGRLNNT
ncbi:MAG: DUF1801 domain-containing protein [archaeon]